MKAPPHWLDEVRKKVARSWARDLASAEAARAAFFLSLATFPAAMVLFSLAGLLGTEQALDGFVREIAHGLPSQAADVLAALMREVKAASTPGLLSLSAFLTLLWASSVIESLAVGVDRAYRVKKRRAWWRLKGISLLLLVANSLLLVAGAVAVLAGPRLFTAIGLDAIAAVSSWLLIWALMTLELWIIYYVLPAPQHPRNAWSILVGAITGTALWVIGTILFRIYLKRFADYNLVYGVLGGVLVWLLWLYLSAAAVFLGAEVAAVLERRSARLSKR